MKRSYAALHAAVILAGFTGIFGKLISLNEGLLVFYRVLFSAIWLFLIVGFFQIRTNIPFREKFHIGKVGILITVHWLFFYASIKYANISIGVVCYSLTSFFTAIFDPLINKKKFVLTEIGLSCLTLLGIALIFHFDASYQLGIILGVISSAFAALYTIYNVRLVQRYDSRVINYYQMTMGAIAVAIILPIYLHYFPVKSIIPEPADIVYLIILSLVCTVILYILFAEALKKISAFAVNLTFNLEPVYAILIAFLFFAEGQEVNLSFYIGLFFVAASVVLQTLITVRSKHNLRLPP